MRLRDEFDSSVLIGKEMPKHGIRNSILAIGIAVMLCNTAMAKTWRLKGGREWASVSTDPEERYAHALAEIKKLLRAGQAEDVKAALEQLKEEFPDRVGPDLDLFVKGELHYWSDRYAKALVQYEKLLKDYPGSELADPVLEREYTIGQAYLGGRKKRILGLFKIAGYAEGVEIMERISDRAGLDEPNSIGLSASIAVAEHYEHREQYLDAYLKWSEIASYWDTGPVGKRAIFRMAEDNVAAYDQQPPERKHHFDASKLTTARTYYEKFLALYPEDAKRRDVRRKIEQIDEQMSYKQYTIGQYYQRTGNHQAAHLYFDMIVRNWPDTEAAAMARRALEESIRKDEPRGK